MVSHIRLVENSRPHPGSEAKSPATPRRRVYVFLNQEYTVAAFGRPGERGRRSAVTLLVSGVL
jgi:hypothetical protein